MLERKKFGKAYTTITGINEHEVDMDELAKKLKNKLACAGTGKDGVIALQGDHLRSVKDALVELGFSADTIDVKQDRRQGPRPTAVDERKNERSPDEHGQTNDVMHDGSQERQVKRRRRAGFRTRRAALHPALRTLSALVILLMVARSPAR